MQSLADSGVFWGLLIAGIIAIYMLPTIIGLIRGVDHLALVFVVNLLGAPTWVGWFAALILAFGPRPLPPAPPFPPPQPYPWPQRDAAGDWVPGQRRAHR